MKRFLRPSLKNLVGKKDLIGVEVGVFLGSNSVTMFENLDIKKLYLIDPYDINTPIFNAAGYNSGVIEEYAHDFLEPYTEKIVWIKDISDNIIYYIDDQLDFAYLDGDHTYAGVMKDLNNFYHMIKLGGLIGGHDFDEENKGNQVRSAVYDFFAPLNKKVYFDFDPYDKRTQDWWVFKLEE